MEAPYHALPPTIVVYRCCRLPS
ncbi:uncharacterized protein G2W53_042059 [Senna tora]|uniref:Uncharacterized protein n=1 Tax=Senna tora TaxID=362788 RepID=A0A834SIG6_9FABA|nr:uncharacterized protein G2W53_042059 [Senna tora]